MTRVIDKDKLITSMAWHDKQGMISRIDDVLDIIEADRDGRCVGLP